MIAVCPNPYRDSQLSCTLECMSVLNKLGYDCCVCPVFTDESWLPPEPMPLAALSEILDDVSHLVVIGGDGTILAVVRQLQGREIPIIGIIFLLIHTFSSSNINRRSFARSYWCRLLLIILILALLYALAFATGRSEEFKEAITQYISEKITGGEAGGVASSYDSYESIYNEYAQKIRDAAPGLIEEFNSEAKANTSGNTGLAEISNAKISKLAEIENQGTQEMADTKRV